MDSNTFSDFPEEDLEWGEEHWKKLLEFLISKNLINWQEITALTLGHLNPSQVGTSIASNKNFQAHFPPRKTWLNVRRWYFSQSGRCADCNTRLELQADHLIPKEIIYSISVLLYQDIKSGNIRDKFELDAKSFDKLETELENYSNFLISRSNNRRNPPHFSPVLKNRIAQGISDCVANDIIDRRAIEGVADQLENMILRCRRCNVIRRPSHKNGGLAFLTTEAALMWILFVKRPKNYQAFQDLCRAYGMTMANIRFQEAWAMAKWLQQDGVYNIDTDCEYY